MTTTDQPGNEKTATAPSANEPVETETERLRRHLRALSAVNNQLHAQLESGGRRAAEGGRDDFGGDARLSTLALRRAAAGSQWIEQLQLSGSVSDPFLVRNAKRGNFLVEGTLRRQVKAGMLYSALEGILGAGREVGAGELDRWNEGPPVEVLEAPSGPAFIVVAGRRLTLRGLPLPNPVTAEEMSRFPEGQELRIGGGSSAGRGRMARVRALVSREGVVTTGVKVLKRGTRKVVRKLRAAAK